MAENEKFRLETLLCPLCVTSYWLVSPGGKALEVVGQGGDPLSVEFPMHSRTQTRDCSFILSGLRSQGIQEIERLESEHSTSPDDFIPNIAGFCARSVHSPHSVPPKSPKLICSDKTHFITLLSLLPLLLFSFLGQK